MVAMLTLRAEEHELMLDEDIGSRRSSWDDAISSDRPPAPPRFETQVFRDTWGRHAFDAVMLLLRAAEFRRPRARRPTDHERDHGIVALARIETGRRTVPGMRQAIISDWRILPTPIPLWQVTATMPPIHAGKVWEIALGFVRSLPPGAATALRHALLGRIAGYDDLIEELSASRYIHEIAGAEGERLQQQRDRLATALRMFGAQWQDATPVDLSASALPTPIRGFARRLRVMESDLITDDASVFPGWVRAGARSNLGWWAFERKGRRLYVKNIDKERWEAQTGGDLVYLRCDPDAFTVVQYKCLEQISDGAWVYRPDSRIARQLQRMRDLENAARPEQRLISDHREYRLTPSPLFVKFVIPRPYRPSVDELLPGYYLPSELVRLYLDHGMARGPRGGQMLRVPELRYIDSQTFVRLVQDCWIGSHGELSRLLGRILLYLKDPTTAGDSTVAYDVPL
jgi:hypothetical protein